MELRCYNWVLPPAWGWVEGRRVHSSLGDGEGRAYPTLLGATLSISSVPQLMWVPGALRLLTVIQKADISLFSLISTADIFTTSESKMGKAKNKLSLLFLLSRFEWELSRFCRLTSYGFWEVGAWPHPAPLKLLFSIWASIFWSPSH